MRRRDRKMRSMIILVVLLDIYTLVMYFSGKLTGIFLDTWLQPVIIVNIVVVVLLIILAILKRKK